MIFNLVVFDPSTIGCVGKVRFRPMTVTVQAYSPPCLVITLTITFVSSGCPLL